jgi:hypothetical protein
VSWDEALRREVAEACRQAEAEGRKIDAWLAQHQERQDSVVQKYFRGGLVYRVNENALVGPATHATGTPPPAEEIPTLPAAAQARWDRWADNRIAEAIARHDTVLSEPLRALVSMSAALAAMASFLDDTNRIALAEILRDSADEVERRREVEPVD